MTDEQREQIERAAQTGKLSAQEVADMLGLDLAEVEAVFAGVAAPEEQTVEVPPRQTQASDGGARAVNNELQGQLRARSRTVDGDSGTRQSSLTPSFTPVPSGPPRGGRRIP